MDGDWAGVGRGGCVCPGFTTGPPTTRSQLPPARFITSLIHCFDCSLYENSAASPGLIACTGARYSNLVPMSRRQTLCVILCVVMTESGCQALEGIPGPGQIVEK